MLREAFALAAKGYHLQKITEQITAVEHFKRYMARTLDTLHEELARRAHEGQQRLAAYVSEIVTQVRRESGTIHTHFRHDVGDVLNTFVRTLDASLQALHCTMSMRVPGLPTQE